jgi:hypothetical protein
MTTQKKNLERSKKFQIRLSEQEYDNLKKLSYYFKISMTAIMRHPATINFEDYVKQAELFKLKNNL